MSPNEQGNELLPISDELKKAFQGMQSSPEFMEKMKELDRWRRASWANAHNIILD